ncbi:MAG TPA: hypothetical protein VMM92_02295, partial [Thermoanaerobaculia bacterium]|nr:hypothetical protein [Thermoanaerobaculia bacterium]
AAQGSRQEALLGCDFVLRMDPHFEPARRLLDRLKVGSGAVPVDDLKAGGDSLDAPGGLDALDALEDLPSLEDDLPDFGSLGGLGGLGGNGSSSSDLRTQLEELFAARRFQDFLTQAQSDPATVAADPDLRKLAELAQERLEAEPYINRFLTKAREAQKAGQTEEMERMLERARSLDATHPGIAEVEGQAPVASGPVASELPAALRPTSTPPLDLFSEGGGDSESERRIAQLLDEGQAALNGGDPQAAIDAWSRIFLIDIDHQEAARRIEQARKLKAENERQVEEIFHDGLNRLEAGDLAAARRAFEQVLSLQPGYLAAREYLQQLDSGQVPVLAPRSAVRETAAPIAAAPSASSAPEPSPLSLPDLAPETRDLKEEILVPPELGSATPRERREPRKAAGKGASGSRRFLYIGGAVLGVVLVGGGVLYLNKDSIFPNLPSDHAAAPAPPAGPGAAPAADPVARATALHNQGKVANALALLKRLPPTHPRYAEAQKLLAQWEGAAPAPAIGTEATTGAAPGVSPAAGAPGAPGKPGAPAAPISTEAAAHRQELLEAARKSFSAADFIHASDQFEQAAALAKLDGADADQFAQVKKRLQPLAEQVKLFKQHDWEYALRALWPYKESNPDDPNVNRLIVDSYYNLGIRDLQRADPSHAAGQFAEALKLEPRDAAARRHYLFAQTYQERPQDLLFRIYVKYLPYR